MVSILRPWQIVVLALAGWIGRQQLDVSEYLKEENRVLREHLKGKRIRFTDDQCRRLAAKAKSMGRKVMHWASTAHPCMDWVIQQLREADPWRVKPRYLYRDNDSLYGHGVRAFLDHSGIEEVRIAYRSPWQNPLIERFIGTLRRELLDHLIILNQRHLDGLLREYIENYYHVVRPHQSLDGDTPAPQGKKEPIAAPTKLISTAVIGGLHHTYTRVAA